MNPGGLGGVGVICVVRFVVAVAVAMVLGLAVGIPVLTMGLVVPFHVVGPLALFVGALVAALGAAWVGNLFAEDRSRLLLVVAVAEASAVVVLLVMLAAAFLPGLRSYLQFAPMVLAAVVCVGGVAVGAGVAALRLRGPRGRLGWDGAAALLASVVVFVLGVSVGGAGLLPGVLDFGVGALGYGGLVRIGVLSLLAGASLWVARSGRYSPGHELGRDAAMTLALVAAILPGVGLSIHLACSNFVVCSG